MSYRLYRLASPCDDPALGELLGVYPNFDAALEARDDDAVALLAEVEGRPMLACHTIVGPEDEAAHHPVTSSLGAAGDDVDVDDVLADARAWLRDVHTTT